MDGALAPLFEALGQSGPAQWLRFSRWGYAAANTAHVLAIAALFGAILPLDLRLLGLWRSVPLEGLARVLVPVAATGLALALGTGLLLFATRATEYAALDLFWIKMILVAAGSVHAVALEAGPGLHRLGATERRLTGGFSLCCWLGALGCGRFLAFAGD